MQEAPSTCLALSAPDYGVSDGYSRGSSPTLHEPSPMSSHDFRGPATFLTSLSQFLTATAVPLPCWLQSLLAFCQYAQKQAWGSGRPLRAQPSASAQALYWPLPAHFPCSPGQMGEFSEV